jgi:hypothetical protein
MEKIKVQNVKTGKVSEITKIAFEQLKKGGHAKNFDVLENAPKKQIKFNVTNQVESEGPESEVQVSEDQVSEKPKTRKSKSL